MTEQEVGMLLARIAAFDGRTSGASEIHAWALIAERGRWTMDEATEQVVKFFERDQPGWLMPGKVNQMIREDRQDKHMRTPVHPAGVGVLDGSSPYPIGDDPDWGKSNSPELESIHQVCLPFVCEYCKQPAGSRCMNLVTKNGTKIPHLSRLKQAGVNNEFPPRP